eukprot:6189409-Pleurochrysis_carterae.AAC.2
MERSLSERLRQFHFRFAAAQYTVKSGAPSVPEEYGSNNYKQISVLSDDRSSCRTTYVIKRAFPTSYNSPYAILTTY